MDPAITPKAPAGEAGFTLIELLVSVAILSVLAVGASLTLSRPAAHAQGDAEMFRATFETTRQLALAGAQTQGLSVSFKGLRPMALRDGKWQEVGQLRPWAGRVSLSARPILGAAQPTPDIVFLANGQTSAFRVVFDHGAFCERDEAGGARCRGG